MLNTLKEKNPSLTFLEASSKSKLYKKVDIDVSEIVEYSKKNITADEDNSYIASDFEAEGFECVKDIKKYVFGEAEVQCGWCCGGGKKMNGMEWHKSSEVIVACTDMVLLLGDFFDIQNDTYGSEKAFALYLEKGEAVELYPMTLHLAPLKVNELFKAAIILPKNTNLPLEYGIKETLRAKNKWLLVHKENIKGISLGGKIGIEGKNIVLNH